MVFCGLAGPIRQCYLRVHLFQAFSLVRLYLSILISFINFNLFYLISFPFLLPQYSCYYCFRLIMILSISLPLCNYIEKCSVYSVLFRTSLSLLSIYFIVFILLHIDISKASISSFPRFPACYIRTTENCTHQSPHTCYLILLIKY